MARISRKNILNFIFGISIGFFISKALLNGSFFEISKPRAQRIRQPEIKQPETEVSTTATSASTTTDEKPPVIDIEPLKRLPDPSKQCPYESDDLEGENHRPAAFLPTWREIHALSSSLGIVDGCYQPSDCTPVEKVAIIIPYKDREDHLLKWLWHMHQMLVRQRRSYCVFVSEPMGAGHFNKGSTMNAAAKEAINRGFDCIVLHDVDMLLEDDRNIYQCQDGPVHLSPFIDKFHYKDHYGTEFGGVTMLKKEHYLAANGYSNLFWGWGREDDDMVYRVKFAGLQIRKPVNYDSGRYSMIPHQHPWAFRNSRITDKNSDLRFLDLKSIGMSKKRAKFEGISSIEYKLKKEEKEPGYIKLNVDFRPLDVNKIDISLMEGPPLLAIQPYKKEDKKYLELKETYICKDFGFSSVMKWLSNWKASKKSAIDKCSEFSDYCIAIVHPQSPDASTGFNLREVSQLISTATAAKADGCPCEKGGCSSEVTIEDHPVVYHHQELGSQMRLHVIEDTLKLQKEASFKIDLGFNWINGGDKGVFYRHALVWEGQAVDEVLQIELMAPGTKSDARDGTQFQIDIPTPAPGWYTVLSKITDVIGQPMFELRWAFRVTTQNQEEDNRILANASASQLFKGTPWSNAIPFETFQQNLEKYFDKAQTSE